MGIKKSNYVGYVWMSDAQQPKVLENEEFEDALEEESIPFIIEAQLYDPETKQSTSVKYVDGKYLVNTYENVSLGMETGRDDIVLKEYVGNRGMNDKTLLFLQFWREVADERCCGMKVLQPQELVFVGFKQK